MIIHNGPKSGHIDGTPNDDKIYGEGGDDRIGGHGGNDYLSGGIGNDHLHGGEGNDTLVGGAGLDVFVFKEFGKANADIVKDFKHGTDHVALDSLDFTVLSGDDLKAGEFVNGTHAKDTHDHIIYDQSTGHLFYDDDGTGSHKQQLIATFTNDPHLTSSDFIVFID